MNPSKRFALTYTTSNFILPVDISRSHCGSVLWTNCAIILQLYIEEGRELKVDANEHEFVCISVLYTLFISSDWGSQSHFAVSFSSVLAWEY